MDLRETSGIVLVGVLSWDNLMLDVLSSLFILLFYFTHSERNGMVVYLGDKFL
jgi:hypothetical protein